MQPPLRSFGSGRGPNHGQGQAAAALQTPLEALKERSQVRFTELARFGRNEGLLTPSPSASGDDTDLRQGSSTRRSWTSTDSFTTAHISLRTVSYFSLWFSVPRRNAHCACVENLSRQERLVIHDALRGQLSTVSNLEALTEHARQTEPCPATFVREHARSNPIAHVRS
jgi:hypothetical protein